MAGEREDDSVRWNTCALIRAHCFLLMLLMMLLFCCHSSVRAVIFVGSSSSSANAKWSVHSHSIDRNSSLSSGRSSYSPLWSSSRATAQQFLQLYSCISSAQSGRVPSSPAIDSGSDVKERGENQLDRAQRSKGTTFCGLVGSGSASVLDAVKGLTFSRPMTIRSNDRCYYFF